MKIQPTSDWRALEVLKARDESIEKAKTIQTIRAVGIRSIENLNTLEEQAIQLISLSHKILRYIDQKVSFSDEEILQYIKDAEKLNALAKENQSWAQSSYLEMAVHRKREFIDHVTKPQDEFMSQIAKHFTIVDVDHDGNCGFKALAKALNPEISNSGEEAMHVSLRSKLIDHLRENADRLSIGGMYYNREENLVPFDEYIEYMSKLGTFADELAMKALSEILERPIYIYNPGTTSFEDEKPMPVDTARLGEEFDAEPLHLLRTRDHFQVLYPKT